MNSNQKSRALVQILVWAFCVGVVSFAAGWFGPAYFAPSSNLAPLLGIFVTGPLGTLAGALIGALSAAKYSRRLAITCIGLVWTMTMFYTFWAFYLGGWAAIPAIPLQLFVLASIMSKILEPCRRQFGVAFASRRFAYFAHRFPSGRIDLAQRVGRRRPN